MLGEGRSDKVRKRRASTTHDGVRNGRASLSEPCSGDVDSEQTLQFVEVQGTGTTNSIDITRRPTRQNPAQKGTDEMAYSFHASPECPGCLAHVTVRKFDDLTE